MPARTLLIRADANAEIGLGHVMRCAALAQAWRNPGGRAIFALATGPQELEDRLRSEGSEIARICAKIGSGEDAAGIKELCQRYRAEWLVLDGFHFSHDYRASVRDGTFRLLLVDDHGDRAPYRCDIVLNANPQASDAMYTLREGQTRFLLGSRYALLRPEFLEFQGEPSDVPDVARRVLITFGGADPHNVTLKVVEALQEVKDLPIDITVVIGVSNPYRTSVQEAVDRSLHSAKVFLNVDNMAEIMSQADLAITAGGGTCHELAFMRVPMFLITMAKNHEGTVKAYVEARAALAAGWFDSLEKGTLAASLRRVIVDRGLRKNLRENASRMVDGRGAQRVVEVMRLMSQNLAEE